MILAQALAPGIVFNMTKQEVMKLIKAKGSKGNAIAQALKDYFAQEIGSGGIKPMQYYHAGDLQRENINGKNDIVKVAQQIFAV